jgi:hypothetical protein|tara:strand:- start:88 stop:363 length:276 start_codon:yes stop_codon:yes gene_type:complete
MEVERSERLEINLSQESRGSVFVHSYSDRVDLDFNDISKNGVSHAIEIKIPIVLARALAKELTDDLAEFDKKVAEKAAEKLAEELAESSEN